MSKVLLQKALKELPADFALNETRQLIHRAIHTIESVENKRNKRKIAQQIEIQNVGKLPANLFQQTIDKIDKMIEEEKEKLSSLKTRKNNDDNIENGPLLG